MNDTSSTTNYADEVRQSADRIRLERELREMHPAWKPRRVRRKADRVEAKKVLVFAPAGELSDEGKR